jgi:hypothetical protein
MWVPLIVKGSLRHSSLNQIHVFFEYLRISAFFAMSGKPCAGRKRHRMPDLRNYGRSKADVGGISICRPCGSHFSRGGKPPMSNRVIARNSFVPPARSVASVLLLCRVVRSDGINLRLTAGSPVCAETAVPEASSRRDASAGASCLPVTPPRWTAAF